MMLPAIVLDCHLRSQEGVLASLTRNGLHVIGMSPDPQCPAFSSRYIHQRVCSPRLEDDPAAYVDFLLQFPEKGVLILSSDLSTLTLAKHEQRLKTAGYTFLLPELTQLEGAFDKWDCFRLAESVGVKAPQSILIDTLDEALSAWEQLKKPVIVKGTRLAGGNYIKLHNIEDLHAAWDQMQENNNQCPNHHSKIILQEWIHYEITDLWSCETVFDHNGEPLGFYSIQRIRSSLSRETGSFTSRLFAGEYVKNARLEAITEKLLRAAQWKGLAHVEYMYCAEDDDYYLAEVNPRLPGYSYFPSSAGFEMAYLYYQSAIQQPTEQPATFHPAVYFESFRYPGDLSEGLYHIIKGNLALKPFFLSYLALFRTNTIKVIDPIRLSDLRFSIKSLYVDYAKLFREGYSWLSRKIKSTAR